METEILNLFREGGNHKILIDIITGMDRVEKNLSLFSSGNILKFKQFYLNILKKEIKK